MLADIFGVNFQGNFTKYPIFNYMKITTDSSFIPEIPHNLMPFGGMAVNISTHKKALALLSFLQPLASRYVPLTKKGIPALVLNKAGKGKSLYFASNIENLYYEFNIPEYRWLIQSFIKENCSLPIELPVNKDLPIETVVRQQHNRYVIHLMNYCSFDNRPFIAVQKLSNILIRLNIPVKINSVYAAKLNKYLSIAKKGSYCECILPALEEYEVLIVE